MSNKIPNQINLNKGNCPKEKHSGNQYTDYEELVREMCQPPRIETSNEELEEDDRLRDFRAYMGNEELTPIYEPWKNI